MIFFKCNKVVYTQDFLDLHLLVCLLKKSQMQRGMFVTLCDLRQLIVKRLQKVMEKRPHFIT
jgi:hypothetical protein